MSKESYINFIQYSKHGLSVGKYNIVVSQEVTSPVTESYKSNYNFYVRGDRFSLDKKYINGVFPSNGSQGDFSMILPHISLKREKFPWIVDFKASNSLNSTSENFNPWIALLVFDSGDQPAVNTGTIENLVDCNKTVQNYDNTSITAGTLPSKYFSHFSASSDTKISLNAGESVTETCTYIDVPINIFNSIAPSADDIQYLAHVREVTTDNKSASKQNTEFATIIANRLPEQGKRSIVHLVSLDGFYDAMPKLSTNPNQYSPSEVLSDYTKVRLVSFYSWSFDTLSEISDDFASKLQNINLSNNGTLVYPIPKADVPSFDSYNQALAHQESGTLQQGDDVILINYAASMGYLVFPHETREGGSLVSWYRGPCTPYLVKLRGTEFLPVSSSDALSGYNTATGLFDLSYSAAWQLGQLLAISNSSLALQLVKWKNDIRKQANSSQMLTSKSDNLTQIIKWLSEYIALVP